MAPEQLLKLFHNYIELEDKHEKRPTGNTRDTLKKYRKILKKELDEIFHERPQSQILFEAS